jgi:uridylate kinase
MRSGSTAPLDKIVGEVKGVVALGVQVAVVIGGGNIFRGVSRCRGHGPRERRLHGHARHRDQCDRVG